MITALLVAMFIWNLVISYALAGVYQGHQKLALNKVDEDTHMALAKKVVQLDDRIDNMPSIIRLPRVRR